MPAHHQYAAVMSARKGLAGVATLGDGLVMAGALFAVLLSVLVWVASSALVMANDHHGRPVLTAAAPGRPLTGGLVLGNRGLLPFAYSLTMDAPDSAAVILEVRQAPEGRLLYRGPANGRTTIGLLLPGESVKLAMALSVPAGSGGPAQLQWTAQARPLADWHGMFLVALIVALASAVPLALRTPRNLASRREAQPLNSGNREDIRTALRPGAALPS
jgi:hypothetical protein